MKKRNECECALDWALELAHTQATVLGSCACPAVECDGLNSCCGTMARINRGWCSCASCYVQFLLLPCLATLCFSLTCVLKPFHPAIMISFPSYLQDGKCIVHDMFDHEVVRSLRLHYSDAFLTAHFEVPGEMFALAMSARTRGRGVVGSTQNILDFINARTSEALQRGTADRLQFVLGTESGMVTSIVRAVQAQLREAHAEGKGHGVEVEIVFPVDSSAVAVQEGGEGGEGGEGVNGSSSPSSLSPSSSQLLPVVPGVQAGEGCSAAGGCASCPYMKVRGTGSWMKPSQWCMAYSVVWHTVCCCIFRACLPVLPAWPAVCAACLPACLFVCLSGHTPCSTHALPH